jgi:Putative adhesin
VRVEAEHSERQTIEIRPGEQSLVVRGRSRIGPMSSVDFTITVPTWMAVSVNGMGTDVVLDGVGGDVNVETTRGDIRLRGGSGFISVKSVQGSITIENAKGRIEAQTVNDSVRVADTSGDLTVGTTNGSIVLERIDTANLDASTVNGMIGFDGSIRDKGSYRLTTHNGAVSMAIPERVNATLRVRTYGGSFRSTFPLKLDDQDRQNRFTLTLGDGSARIELESFNGSIALRRPGEPRPQAERDRDRGRGPRGRAQNPPAPPSPPPPPPR